jgi:hypothetical protein
MCGKITFIIMIIIIIIIIIILFYINQELLLKEKFANYSDYSKNPILNDCKEGWGKDYAKAKNITYTDDLCLSNAYVTNSDYLCGICGNDSPLYAINSPLNNNTIYYGCAKDTNNGIQLNWSQNDAKKLPAPISEIKTCNFQKVDISSFNTLKSYLYLYFICNDTSTVYLNDIKIKDFSKNILNTLFIQDVYVYDKLKIIGKTSGIPNGLSLCYRWNNKLYILNENGFKDSANIMKYKTNNFKSWDKLLNNSLEGINILPPWMKNWLTFNNENGKTIEFETSIGLSENNYDEIKSDLVLYVACDDSCTIYLNDIEIKKFSGWNKLNTLTIKNVYIYDTLKIIGLNSGGPGGLCLYYIWNNKSYILDNNFNNNSYMVMNYSVDNLKRWDNSWAKHFIGSNTLPLWMMNWMRFEDGNNKTITFKTFVGVSTPINIS